MILHSREVPTELKSATPVFKDKGSPTYYGNYMPISCIPHAAKIMDKAINKNQKAYMFDHEFITGITGDESAYRSGHSTKNCTPTSNDRSSR